MSPAFIKGVGEHLPNARPTFDKFRVVAHAFQGSRYGAAPAAESRPGT
jgi:transposase